MMTELLFQKCFLNDKNEKIYHFAAITNLFRFGTWDSERSNCIRFDGDVMVNVNTDKYVASKSALSGMKDNFRSKVVSKNEEALNTLSAPEKARFIEEHCLKEVEVYLLNRCAEINCTIGV